MDFLTVRRVFNFLCLPPKGCFIDKALGSAGRAVEEKLLMERLVARDRRAWVSWDGSSEATPGVGRPKQQAWADEGGARSIALASTSPSQKRGLLRRRIPADRDLANQLRDN